jgi:predicted AAA+ superfamily ATPase
LEEVFFVFAIEKFSYSGRVRIQNPKKVYLGDNIFYTMLFNYINKEQGKAVGIISNAGVQKKRL